MTTFPRDAWSGHAGLDRLLEALDAGIGETRFVGGFVRDTLLGSKTADIDCATRLTPDEVLRRVNQAGFKAVPTGLAHGTITAVLSSGPVEITTLRRDVSTDGRRATIAYTDDWREDAARRDFTINALSADPGNGSIHDYFDGLQDLTAGIVRFIGDPMARIAEDHLRILRFFRFQARFGKGDPDPAGLAACTARANDLMALSRERIADELLKLLALPDPAATVRLMVERGIFRPVIPEIDGSIDRLTSLIEAEIAAGIPPAALRRLTALLPIDADVVLAVAARLKLSNSARKRLASATETAGGPREMAYRVGREGAIDRLLLAGKVDDARAIDGWDAPKLPVSGGNLVSAGIVAGPAVATMLRRIEDRWIAEGFPDATRAREILDEIIRES